MRAAPANGRGHRSPVYLWLRKHHAELSAEFAVSSARWSEIAAVLAERGVLAGSGRTATGTNVQRSWRRVCDDLSAKTATKPSTTAPALTPLLTPPVAPIRSGILDQQSDEPENPFSDWKPATPKGVSKLPQS